MLVVCQQLHGSHIKFFVLLACIVSFQITKPGNVEPSNIFVGIQDHENIFTQKFKIRRFYNTKISRSTVGDNITFPSKSMKPAFLNWLTHFEDVNLHPPCLHTHDVVLSRLKKLLVDIPRSAMFRDPCLLVSVSCTWKYTETCMCTICILVMPSFPALTANSKISPSMLRLEVPALPSKYENNFTHHM